MRMGWARTSGWRLTLAGILVLAGIAGTGAPARAAETNTTVAVPREEIRQLISEIGHPKFAVRNSAQQKLTALSALAPDAILAECIKTYAATSDPELTVRLHDVMFDIATRRVLRPAPGFLGIQMAIAQTTGQKGEARAAISAVRVLPATAAERIGMKNGDLILHIDDLDTGENPSLQAFFQHVRSRQAGDTTKLLIKRGEEFIRLEATLDEVPMDQQGDPEQIEANRKQQFEEWLAERLAEERRKARF